MTKKFLSILLCSLMAVPTLAIGNPARTTPASATATTAVRHLPDAAFRAGVSASRVVFPTDLERNDADAALPQSTRELREICFADAERALQECQEAGRANCSGVYEQERRVCVTRYPYPEEESDWVTVFWVLGALAVAMGIAWAVESGEETDSDY